ncbi:MAG: hypothetical protein HQK72_17500 [Desulfamplus sp.]|nr:hypothetical protein [Desulfamplus sp.]
MNRQNENIIDVRGFLEPIAFLKVSQICREMKTGSIMRIIIEDTDSHLNLLSLLQYFDVQVVEDKKYSDKDAGWQIIIQKHIKTNISQ